MFKLLFGIATLSLLLVFFVSFAQATCSNPGAGNDVCWVCTPSLCVNNGNGNSNSCASTGGGAGCFDGITNLSLNASFGDSGQDTVRLYNGASCNTGADTFSGTVTIAPTNGGTSGSNMVIESDPVTCGTPTFGFTATRYTFSGSNFKIDLASGANYVTLRNFEVANAAGGGPTEAIIIARGAGTGVILEHLRVSKENLTGSQEVVWWNQATVDQGTGVNDAFIVRYNELVGENSDGLNRTFRHVTTTGTTDNLQVYGNSARDAGGSCLFIQPRGTGQTFLADVHHNSLVNCGVETADWLIYFSGARGHIHHNFGDCTDGTGATCASGWRTRGGGSLMEWNAGFRVGRRTGAAGRGMSPFGFCDIQCTEATTFRHNIVTAHSNIIGDTFAFNLAGDSADVINLYNNTFYGFNRALHTNNTSTTRTYRIKNNLFLGTGIVNNSNVIHEALNVDGTFDYQRNLFDWGSATAFFFENETTGHATIAAACADTEVGTRFNCNNKGGTGVNESLIVHNPTRDPATADFTPANVNSGALGYAAMTDGESAHRTGWGDGTLGTGPVIYGQMHLGAVGNGFPCVGAWELERERLAGNNGLSSEVPTYRCGGLIR